MRDVELISQNKRIFRRELYEQKVIFLDIDGTLAEPGHSEPPASAIEAVRKSAGSGKSGISLQREKLWNAVLFFRVRI